MIQFGQFIKEIRESKNLLQRDLAASLEIDIPMFSKIERGKRKAKRHQVIHIAKLLEIEVDELLTIWLADQVYNLVKGEEIADKALKVAENIILENESTKHK